ncbi:MAG: hypothetical protein R6X10_14205 [Desulfobacterales bacterium]
MKKLKNDLQAVSREIKSLSKKLERLVKSAGRGGNKASAKKTAPGATAFDTVITLISRSKTGVTTSQLKTKTGFDDKKIANIIYKGKNRGLIKSISKGIYKKT